MQYNLRRKQKINDIGVVDFDQSTNNPKRRKPQILEWTRFADSIEKRIEEERHVSVQESGPCVGITRHTL